MNNLMLPNELFMFEVCLNDKLYDIVYLCKDAMKEVGRQIFIVSDMNRYQ